MNVYYFYNQGKKLSKVPNPWQFLKNLNTELPNDLSALTTRKWKALICVRLFATPWTIQSVEFSRPEYWSG